jgi:hypothetical protein
VAVGLVLKYRAVFKKFLVYHAIGTKAHSIIEAKIQKFQYLEARKADTFQKFQIYIGRAG